MHAQEMVFSKQTRVSKPHNMYCATHRHAHSVPHAHTTMHTHLHTHTHTSSGWIPHAHKSSVRPNLNTNPLQKQGRRSKNPEDPCAENATTSHTPKSSCVDSQLCWGRGKRFLAIIPERIRQRLGAGGGETDPGRPKKSSLESCPAGEGALLPTLHMMQRNNLARE